MNDVFCNELDQVVLNIRRKWWKFRYRGGEYQIKSVLLARIRSNDFSAISYDEISKMSKIVSKNLGENQKVQIVEIAVAYFTNECF